jgi:hypothetical protein
VTELEYQEVKVENRLALVGGVTAALALVLFVVGVRQVSQQQFPERPDLNKTPGVAASLPIEAVCASSAIPKIPAAVRKSVFDRYGIDRPDPESYQLDLLIPAGLGGTNDPRNLWPQPMGRIEWNAHVKDALEVRLRQLVCDHALPLEDAREAISRNWIGAYQEYFHTRLPLSVHQHQ